MNINEIANIHLTVSGNSLIQSISLLGSITSLADQPDGEKRKADGGIKKIANGKGETGRD
jgi:hypothetical protein